MQMPTPMLATFQVPDISVETADAGEDHPTAETGTVDEPVEELAQLQEAIERRYNKPKPREGGDSEDHVVELTHIRVDPTFKQIDIKQAMESGVERFADSIPVLKKALNELSKIHPVVTVAVLAFEAVIELELTRRENDRRVTVLFVEMKAVMLVITNFKNIRSNDIGQDGIVLSDRLHELAESTAEDIKQCANLCDAFLKSKLLLRVLKGPLWAERFAASMERFARRKEEYSLALAMHTASTVSKMAVDVESINYKIELMHTLFEKYMTATERNLVAEVEKKGGAAKVRHDDALLRTLMGATATKDPVVGLNLREERAKGPQTEAAPGVSRMRTQAKGTDGAAGLDRTFGLEDLKKELREDLDYTIERNFAVFVKKYDFQAQLMSDRIIHAVEAAVGSGSHSRIKNVDLQNLWKEMNWTGVVKGRILVHALREHYSQDDLVPASPTATEIVMSDKWTLEYLNIAWLHPILEAIDDDTSGYISVSEVNRFMQRLPPELNWSLPYWLAYWAVGWKCATTMYLDEVQRLISEFHQSLPCVLAINRPPIDWYLNFITPCWTLLAGMNRYNDSYMCERFNAYIEHEEARLKANLEKFNYRIDALDTLKLVIGSSRIERCAAPLVCLLLRNDVRKVKAAKTFILPEDEFRSSELSMSTIDIALADRCKELQETFRQRKLDPKVELKKFASGLLHHFDRDDNPIPGDWWAGPGSVDYIYSIGAWRNTDTDWEVDTAGITTLTEVPLDTSVYDAVERETEDDLTSDPAVNAIVGTWNGFLYEDNLYPTRPMTTLFFHAAPPSTQSSSDEPTTGHKFVGEGTDYEGSEYSVTGTCVASEEGVDVEWCMEYDGDVTLYFVGRILDEFTLSGNQRYDKEVPGHAYLILKKAPAEYLCYRPPPFELYSQPHPLNIDYDVTPEQRARGWWRYALNAVLHDVRRKRWTWSFFAERRRVRQLWFTMRTGPDHSNHSDHTLREMHQFATTADARVYYGLTELANKMTYRYDNLTCESPNCRRNLSITIVACLDCLSADLRFVVAFCDDPDCYMAEGLVNNDGNPHLSTHRLIKYRTIMLMPYWPTIKARALSYLSDAQYTVPAPAPNSVAGTSPVASVVELPADNPERASVVTNGSEHNVPEDSQERNSPTPTQALEEEGPTETKAEAEADAEARGEAQAVAEAPVPVEVEESHEQEPQRTTLTVVMPQPENAASRWSLRSLLHSAWRREHGASAGDASSTLAPSVAPDPHPEETTTAAAATPELPASALPPSPTDEQIPFVEEPEEMPTTPDDDGGEAEKARILASTDATSVAETALDVQFEVEDNAGEDVYSEVASTYATAQSIISSRAPSSVPWYERPPQCLVCTASIGPGSWYCIECRSFLCSECDGKRLIRCAECSKPFPQPAWFYGMGPLDDFRCDVCSARRRSDTPPPYSVHVHTHPVVLCQPAPPPSPAPTPPASRTPSPPPPSLPDVASVASRLAAVEGRVGQLDALQTQYGAVGARLEQLDELMGQIVQIRDMMTMLLEQQASSVKASSE
ncbi:hypothetical protein VTO73DRAFT_1393 [Trametes versicolor]